MNATTTPTPVVRPRTSHRYKCPHCGKVVVRECGDERPKQWRKSFCETTGKNARIQLLPIIDEVTRTVRALKRAGRWPNDKLTDAAGEKP